MKTSRNALIPLICVTLIAVVSEAGAVDLAQTGTNTVTGTAYVHGDSFSEYQAATDATGVQLYAGAWAHAYVPAGTEGTNTAESERTVPARTESRRFSNPTANGHTYDLTSSYGTTTVIAKASKTGILGSAEAFSEVSALSSVQDTAGTSPSGYVGGNAQLVAYATHSGTGTAEASATGSATYDAMMSSGQIDASGSVSGSAAINIDNNYGGSVKGTAWKGSLSFASSAIPNAEGTASQSFEYLYLTSERNALSDKSDILGTVAGDTTASGFYALAETDKFGNTASSATGDLSGTATTYKPGDSIAPDAIHMLAMPLATQYNSIKGTEKALAGDIWVQSFGRGKGSAMLISQGRVITIPGAPLTQCSYADTESMTSAGVTRTLADTNDASGASYIDNGTISASANTASVTGGSLITLASAGAENIFMGSGAHLVSRLTGANPASAADLQIHALNRATSASASAGSVYIHGNANPAVGNSIVKAVGPAFSTTGTSRDATGSYLTASKIDGTAVHVTDTTFTAASNLIADDIDNINIWSWISGADPIPHAESSTGLAPLVSTPDYTSDPVGVAGVTEGPIVTSGATATSRSIDTVFRSTI